MVPMKLYIDTSSREQTIVKLGDKQIKKSSRLWHSQVVLPMIQKLLHATGHELSAITKIEVHPGPGSYTGLRVGRAVANALGFALKIPVNGKIVDALPHPVI